MFDDKESVAGLFVENDKTVKSLSNPFKFLFVTSLVDVRVVRLRKLDVLGLDLFEVKVSVSSLLDLQHREQVVHL